MTVVVIPYKPRDQQQEIHDLCSSHRFGVTVAHRRFGKSVLYFNELQRRALTTELRNFRAAFVGPTYTQTKSILWDHARHYSAVVPGVKYNESELRVDYPNGSRIRLFGADNPDGLRGMFFDVVVLDEYDVMREELWGSVIRPMVADRHGSAYFIGTYKHVDGPLGRMYDMAQTTPGWFVRTYKASETKILGGLRSREEVKAQIEECRRDNVPIHSKLTELEQVREEISEEEFNREMECVRTAAVKGAIFGRLIDIADTEGRIGDVPYDPAMRVHTAWDMGVGDSTAIWFAQLHGNQVRLIDYHIAEGEGLAYYARVLQEKKYVYGEHIGPHDLAARVQAENAETRLQIAARLGIHFRVLPRVSQNMRAEVDERIEAGRRLLPLCQFDRVHCKDGLSALRSWRRRENAQTGELQAAPLHDWSSHGADAFTYLAMGLRRGGSQTREQPKRNWIV